MIVAPHCPVHGRAHVRLQGVGEPESRFYQIIHRIADRLEPDVQAAFLEAVEAVRGEVDLVELEAAMRSQDVTRIRAALGAQRLRQALGERSGLNELFQRVYGGAGEASAGVLSDALGVNFAFDFRDPNSIVFARTQVGTLITNIDRDQLLMVRAILGRAIEEGIPPARSARLIHDVVGIRHDWAQAPLRLRREILDGQAAAATSRRLDAATKQEIRSRIAAGTVTEEWLDDVQARYAHSLRRRRALDIARTENIRSANAGLHQSWRDGRRRGVIPRTARRHWVVTDDERLRETHALVPFDNPDGVLIDEPFETFLGPVMYPPLEPLCRCGVGLTLNPGQPGVL